jgi:hypothetical protein
MTTPHFADFADFAEPGPGSARGPVFRGRPAFR